MLNETRSAPAFPPPHTFNSQGQDPGGKERTACHTKPAGNRDGNLVKRVTSTDDGTIEDPKAFEGIACSFRGLTLYTLHHPPYTLHHTPYTKNKGCSI